MKSFTVTMNADQLDSAKDFALDAMAKSLKLRAAAKRKANAKKLESADTIRAAANALFALLESAKEVSTEAPAKK